MAEWVAHVRREIAGEPDPVAKIRRLVALHFSVLERDPDLAEVVQVELRQGHKFFRGASAHEVSAYFELIGSVLEEGIAAGQFRADLPVKVATKVLFGAMDQVATSWVLGKRAYRLERRRRAGGHDLPAKESAAMAFETLLLDREETFVVITLNRPPANAISEPLIRELNDALASVRAGRHGAGGDHHRQR